jgi:hypothetical protein
MKGIQQEERERTEKIDLKAPFFPGEHRMHPLFEKASALTETIIAAAVEVHRNKGPGLIESIYEWCLMKELAPAQCELCEPKGGRRGIQRVYAGGAASF